jgi:hypothetical protein
LQLNLWVDDQPVPKGGNVTRASELRSALTASEVEAIEWWLNLGSRLLREFRATHELPLGWTAIQFEEIAGNLDSALAKAPVYTGMVYRGMAASPLCQRHVRELREFVAARTEWLVPRHLSASLSEEIGRGHCHIDQNDEPKEISVLLVCRATTARLLSGFVHKAKDEQEVVLMAGSRFKHLVSRQLESPRLDQEMWQIDLEQVA